MSAEVETVVDWHVALNAGDVERLVALSTDDVEVGGPRGAGKGSDLLRDWVARAQIQLEPLRWYQDDATVVVEQNAGWRTLDGQLTEPQAVASVFRVEGGKVASVIRYDSLAAALQAAGIVANVG